MRSRAVRILFAAGESGIWAAAAWPSDASRARGCGHLLIITGEEITTRNSHYLGLGLPPGESIDWRYGARDDGDCADAARLIHRSGGIVVPAHPYCAFVACRWKCGYDEPDAVEVWNGPRTTDDESAVDTWDSRLAESVRTKRPWLPAMGNSHAHSEPQVIGLPHNVVLSNELSKDAVLDGIRSGRNWIAESSTMNLSFSASSGGGRQASASARPSPSWPRPTSRSRSAACPAASCG
jgi:hypothetical protein